MSELMAVRFSHLCVGQMVFVVHQNQRHEKGLKRRTSLERIRKVGRKYAYIGEEYQDRRFLLTTGISSHRDINQRANGHGFDVYVCEQDYIDEKFNHREFESLKDRMCHHYDRLNDLPPKVVRKIHEILDENYLYQEKTDE